ncbi:MAG: LL-diaminopimelate aminotransferase [Bacteroides sp.]|nr:LL-diaminopimelate aminotransferase [Bacteroides sp.]
MFTANQNFRMLPESYLFSEVGRRLREFKEKNPGREVIRMDIGDVTRPLPECVVEAMRRAIDEMGHAETFHGYGPEQGYDFLRELILEYDYVQMGVKCLGAEDIFVSDGAKSDLGNLTDIFGIDLRIGVTTPGYPVYADSNVLSGAAGIPVGGGWERLIEIPCPAFNGFMPELPESPLDVIYLCYPNNPTGTSMTREQLTEWVDYALMCKALIIYDSAYEAYITQPGIPHSIYEIPGAEKVAIEVRSFSKTAGFTGVRCGYTVVPRTLEFGFADGAEASLNRMWLRRQTTKFNGVGYIVQKGAEALYTPEGREAIERNVAYYMKNARDLREAIISKRWEVFGGVNAPYVWFRPLPHGDSWKWFERMLGEYGISSTPGVGFGAMGEGWLRLTGFGSRENTREAIDRLMSDM